MDAKTPARGFLYGGLASCMAEGMTMPLDVLKVRMQLQGEHGQFVYGSARQAVVQILRSEGFAAFFKGLKPALLRQGSYGTLRIGLYSPFKNYMGVPDKGPLNSVTIPQKAFAGMLSGAIAACICNPTDLVKVRMQADGMRPDNAPPSYRGIVHAANSILRMEGWRGFYTGVGPTTSRAAVVTMVELVTYDEIKVRLLRHSSAGKVQDSSWIDLARLCRCLGLNQDGMQLHLASALLSGFAATIASSPFDVIKSRVMSQPVDPVTGRGMWYTNMIDCWIKSFRSEGISFMWNGFWPNYLNKGPTVALFFILYERIRLLGDGLQGQL